MSNRLLLAFVCAALVIFDSCKKDDAPKTEPKVDENGLTKDITNLVPQSVLDEMKRLGMPINGGEHPPIINGTYLAAPFKLSNSNVPSDYAGKPFADYQVTFQDQDNDRLTVKVNYVNGPESGNGIGSYIVGDGCKFSVFVEVNSTSGGTNAKLTHVISGTFVEDGIENLMFANFMLDNYGNPGNVWIENGQGRVIYDTDSFSKALGSSANWYANLPDCPCTYQQAQQLDGKNTTCPSGEWDIGTADQSYHYGASYEARWSPTIGGRPGQQCTYDAAGSLITRGLAAGSVDSVSPKGGEYLCSHYRADIVPWGDNTWTICNGGTSKIIPCWQYLLERPVNKGTGNCSSGKAISTIDHTPDMEKMTKNMTCEEATLFIRAAKESANLMIDPALKNYILGVNTSLTAQQLIPKLQDWKVIWSCGTPATGLCLAIDKAIAGLQ